MNYESLSHSKWDCKYHVVFIPQVPREGALRGTEAASGRGVPQAGSAEGKPNRTRSPHAGSRPHDDFDPTEVRGLTGGWLYQRKRAQFIWPGRMERGSATSWDSISGPEGTSSTVGRDEAVIREYIKNQEQEDKRLDQLNLWR
jgi:putative transposase